MIPAPTLGSKTIFNIFHYAPGYIWFRPAIQMHEVCSSFVPAILFLKELRNPAGT